jgi:enamine deaminase RidA (YjgF/YER057c/UK114 family)
MQSYSKIKPHNPGENEKMPIDVVNPPHHQRTADAFHFSAAARANGLLILSGQIGANADGSPISAEEEFRNAWQGIGAVLEEAGKSFADILEYTSYHVNMHDHLGSFMKVRDEFISEPWPAWTAIGCTDLAIPGARVEIKVVAG